ncbi:MAG: hypothetical protein AAGA17_07255 [Actinomycetota bacterium]
MIQRAPWPPQRLLLLVALPAFLVLAAATVALTVPGLEDDLRRQAVRDLEAAGFDLSTLQVSFDGRDATVRGTVESQSARATIDDVVSGDGVRSVTVLVRNVALERPSDQEPEPATEATEAVDLPADQRIIVQLVDGVVVLRGRIRTESSREVLTQRLAGVVAPTPLSFELLIDGTVERSDTFGAVVDAVAATLPGANELEINVDERVLAVSVTTFADTAAVTERLEEIAAESGLDAVLEVSFEAPRQTTEERLATVGTEFAADSFFVPGTSELLPETELIIAGLAGVLAIGTDPVEVRVHVDGEPGPDATALSQTQADVVVAALIEAGAAVDGLTAVGLGADVPVADAGDPANRRIEIVVVAT